MALVNFLSLLLITPVIAFYLLVDWHPMPARVDGSLPRDHAPTIRRLAAEINAAVSAFVRGQGAICLILGIYYGAGLSWARHALRAADRAGDGADGLRAGGRLGAGAGIAGGSRSRRAGPT